MTSQHYLHSSLDHINWGISKHTGSSSDPTNEERSNTTNVFAVVPLLKPFLETRVDKEADGLVGALLDDGGGEALICSSQSCGGGGGRGGRCRNVL